MHVVGLSLGGVKVAAIRLFFQKWFGNERVNNNLSLS